MCAFAQSTRNVHKELKDTLANSKIIMAQYIKVLRQERNNTLEAKEYKIAHTQTQEYAQTVIYYERMPCHVATQTVAKVGDSSSDILSAIVEVENIIARTDTRVPEQQCLIEKLQRQLSNSQLVSLDYFASSVDANDDSFQVVRKRRKGKKTGLLLPASTPHLKRMGSLR